MPFINRYKFRRENKAFNNFGNTVLLKAKDALEEIDVHFWLDFGTLLGVYRDGKLIGHDTDVDIAIFLKDYSPKIEEAMQKHGFSYTHRIDIDNGTKALEQSFAYKDVAIDIFYYTQQGDQNVCHLFPLNKQKERVCREIYTTFDGFTTIDFLDTQWQIPKNTEQRLSDTYGEEFRIPIKNWYTPDDALNSKLTNDICKETKYN